MSSCVDGLQTLCSALAAHTNISHSCFRLTTARAMGRITTKGHFHLIPEKADQYLFEVPSLQGFTLKPYIQSSTADPLGRPTYLKR